MRKTAFGLGGLGRMFNSPAKIGLGAMALGGLGAAGIGLYGDKYRRRAMTAMDEGGDSDRANGYRLPDNLKYSLNSRTNGVLSVYTDRDKAIADMREAGLLGKEINENAIDYMIGGGNPAYISSPVHAAFLPDKYRDTRVMAHEVGHGYDKHMAALDRLPFLPRNMIPGLYDPDQAALVRQEARAWDNAGVPAGDPVREAALDTYRAQVRGILPAMISAGALYGGGTFLGGYGAYRATRRFSDWLMRRKIDRMLSAYRPPAVKPAGRAGGLFSSLARLGKMFRR